MTRIDGSILEIADFLYLILLQAPPESNMPSELIQKIASDAVIDTAYEWLCKRRKDYSHNDDV